MTQNKQRSVNLDVVRAVATVFVLSSHFLLRSGFYGEPMLGKRMYLMTLMRYVFVTCVPNFLLLTGYLSGKKRPSAVYFKKIIPTLGLYVLASIVCLVFRRFYAGEDIGVKVGLLSILDYSASYYGWYVEMYIGLFFLAPFLNILYDGLETRKNKRIWLCVLVALVCGPSVLNIFDLVTPGFWQNPALRVYDTKLVPDWWVMLYPVMYYSMGIYLREFGCAISTRKNLLLIGLSVLVFGSFNYYRSYGTLFIAGTWLGRSSLQNLVISVLLFVLLLNLDYSRLHRPTRWVIRRISTLSFLIYLLSAVSDALVYPVLADAVPDVTTRLNYFPAVILASLVLAALGAQVVHWAFLGLRKLLRFLLAQRAAAAA